MKYDGQTVRVKMYTIVQGSGGIHKHLVERLLVWYKVIILIPFKTVSVIISMAVMVFVNI